MTEARIAATFDAFRVEARRLLAAGMRPESISWSTDDDRQTTMALGLAPTATDSPPTPRVPRAFFDQARFASIHREAGRFALLYRVLFRLSHGEVHLMEDAADPDILRLQTMAGQVGRDIHKMHAFVRFRRIEANGEERFAAWHRPDHHILEAAVPFFADRFQGMRWSLFTPDRAAHWDGQRLTFGPGLPCAPSEGSEDEGWRSTWLTYYQSIFNPARLNLRAMTRELPRRHWATLPEAALIGTLASAAPQREASMRDPALTRSAADYLPDVHAPLAAVAQAARTCQACPLHRPATQTVFGEGPVTARLMLVGEQPGDEEDKQGHPFAGPAGAILDEALVSANLARESIYITNAVKHFKFVFQGKRRLHQKPSGREVQACKPWLMAEIARIRPRVLVALGGTAGQSLFGAHIRPTRDRGRLFAHPLAEACLVTFHPSAVLRALDPASRETIRAALEADLAVAARALEQYEEPARQESNR